jgi:hypothetical protein
MELPIDIPRGYQCGFLDRYLKILSIGGIYSRIIIGGKYGLPAFSLEQNIIYILSQSHKFHAIGSGSVYLNSKINTSWFRRLTMI